MARLHELIGRHLDEGAGDAEVVIGIETDRGKTGADRQSEQFCVPLNRKSVGQRAGGSTPAEC
jgi:hypothetical protein